MHDEHDALDEELVDRIRTYAEAAEEAVSVPAAIAKFDLPPTAGDAVAELLDGEAPASGSSKKDESGREEADTSTATPGPEAAEPGEDDADSDVSKYRRIYLDAADRAGRESWEFVEEAAIREALADEGFAQLLDRGDLFQIGGWRVVDTSDDDEEARRRWYYPSEHEPRPDEFRRFHDLLTEEAPAGYEPFYFRVQKAGKAPATQFGSWKTEAARLSVEEAVEWMKAGGNVGIAGTPDDELVNVDIDDDEATTPEDVPTSLRARSRSRTGWHTWYFDPEGEIPNIPTDEYGEVRTSWQYVVAPGSFVASCREAIPADATDPGYYTVEEEAAVPSIQYDDLPDVFHAAAEAIEAAEEAVEETDTVADRTSDDSPNGSGDAAGSDVFDFEAGALVSATDDRKRFSSIFHGSDTDANMSVSGDILHCWRHNVAHGGLQALAVQSDVAHVRRYGCQDLGAPHKHSNAGANRLKGDWRLIWGAWHEAKQRAIIPEDDPIPYGALRGLALADGLLEREDLVARDTETGEVVEAPDEHEGDTYEAFPTGTYGEALEHVRDEYGVEPGRDVPDYAEPNAPFAFETLDALADGDRERYVRKRGHEIPSTEDARADLRDALFRELRAGNGNAAVLDAPTALGKSYTVATTPWLDYLDVAGDAPTIHLHATRDARDEAARATERSAATGDVLLGRKEASPVARGDHDPVAPDEDREAPDIVVTVDGIPASEWFDTMCDEKQIPFSTALALARERNDQGLEELPPIGEEDPAVRQWDDLPRDDSGDPTRDVVHATHAFAHVPAIRSHTNVIIDEQPDYTVEFSKSGTPESETGRVRSIVGAYLREINAPVTTWESFVDLARHDSDGHRSDAQNEQRALGDCIGQDPEREWFVEDPDAHALAPDLTKAIWNALRHEDADANGRRNAKVFHEPPRLDTDGEHYAGTWLSVVIDDENTIRSVRSTPDFSQARAVIGLDAHPSMPMWHLNVDPEMTRDAVLDSVERQLWRRYERGLTTVQIGEATRPRSGGNARKWMNDDRVRAVLEALRDRYGDEFDTAATTAQVEGRLRQLLEATVDRDLEATEADHLLHFGEEKSRNPAPFVDADAGYVYGCMDPGDDMVLDALAELSLEAEPGTTETEAGEIKREKGRTFEGPDADTARAVLASVRENHVAQAAGRYARNPDDPNSSAVVYVHTDAAPAGFVDLKVPGVEWLPTELQHDIVDVLGERSTASTREIADELDCTKEHVRETLQRLEDEGLVVRRESAGDHGADLYQGDVVEGALVDLGETSNDPLLGPNRWSLVVCDEHRRAPSPQRPGEASVAATSAVNGGDPGDHEPE